VVGGQGSIDLQRQGCHVGNEPSMAEAWLNAPIFATGHCALEGSGSWDFGPSLYLLAAFPAEKQKIQSNDGRNFWASLVAVIHRPISKWKCCAQASRR